MGAYDSRLTAYENVFGISRRNAGNRLRKDRKKMKPLEKFISMLSTEDIEEICKIVDGVSHAKSLNISEYTHYTSKHLPLEKLHTYDKYTDYTLLYNPSIPSSEKTRKNHIKKSEANINYQLDLQVEDIIARDEYSMWVKNIENEFGNITQYFKSTALKCFLNQDKCSLKKIESALIYQKELRINNLSVINNKDAFDINKPFIEQECIEFFKKITDQEFTAIKKLDFIGLETFISYENERNQFSLLINRQINETYLDKIEIINFLLQHFHLSTSTFIAEAMQLDQSVIEFLARKKISELIDQYIINLA